MRILLIAPVHREMDFLKQKEKHPFLVGQAQQSWFDALKKLNHEVNVLRYTDSLLIPNKLRIYVSYFFTKLSPVFKSRFDRYCKKLNILWFETSLKSKMLVNLCTKFKPEIVIISGGIDGISYDSIKFVSTSSKAILISGINPTMYSTSLEKKLLREGIIETVVVNDWGFGQNWKKLGVKKVIVLPISAVDPRIHKKVSLSTSEKAQFLSDVCFVGSLLPERQKVLKELLEFNLKVWGDIPTGVKLDNKLHEVYQGTAYGEKMIKIYNATKVGLNIHASSMKYGGNMRTFEICGSGTFQLIDNLNDRWFKDGKEVMVFKDTEDLKKKIRHYLSHEKEQTVIAENGYKRAIKDHTYQKRFKKLFALIKSK